MTACKSDCGLLKEGSSRMLCCIPLLGCTSGFHSMGHTGKHGQPAGTQVCQHFTTCGALGIAVSGSHRWE